MKQLVALLLSVLLAATVAAEPILVIHGGAGTLSRDKLNPELEQRYRSTMKAALDAGYAVLTGGGDSEDAVVAAIEVMEASPLFNAGVGAVFTADASVELDASIMRGRDQQAGAIAGVQRIRDPIRAALAVLERSDHVMLTGAGAEIFAEGEGLALVDNRHFHTERRLNDLKRRQSRSSKPQLDHDSAAVDHKFGTVGAVALDTHGHLAAGTSTGGMTNKRFGRVGDSPIIGAGTWADAGCAVSATGHGEYFIRNAVSHEICARVRLANQSLSGAANAVIFDVLRPIGGDGGVIALTSTGEVAMPFNTKGMYRAVMRSPSNWSVEIFGAEGSDL